MTEEPTVYPTEAEWLKHKRLQVLADKVIEEFDKMPGSGRPGWHLQLGKLIMAIAAMKAERDGYLVAPDPARTQKYSGYVRRPKETFGNFWVGPPNGDKEWVWTCDDDVLRYGARPVESIYVNDAEERMRIRYLDTDEPWEWSLPFDQIFHDEELTQVYAELRPNELQLRDAKRKKKSGRDA